MVGDCWEEVGDRQLLSEDLSGRGRNDDLDTEAAALAVVERTSALSTARVGGGDSADVGLGVDSFVRLQFGRPFDHLFDAHVPSQDSAPPYIGSRCATAALLRSVGNRWGYAAGAL